MQFGRFRLGMRTIKTAIAVMLCIFAVSIFESRTAFDRCPFRCLLTTSRFNNDPFFWEITSFRKFDWWGYCHHLLLHETIFPQ